MDSCATRTWSQGTASKATCEADTSCFFQAGANKCYQRCDQFTSMYDCLLISQCDWRDETCQRSCGSIHETDSTACNNDLSCIWNKDRKACVKQCDQRLNRTYCATDPTVCYEDTVENGVNEICSLVVTLGANQAKGTYKMYQTEQSMNGTSWTRPSSWPRAASTTPRCSSR